MVLLMSRDYFYEVFKAQTAMAITLPNNFHRRTVAINSTYPTMHQSIVDATETEYPRAKLHIKRKPWKEEQQEWKEAGNVYI